MSARRSTETVRKPRKAQAAKPVFTEQMTLHVNGGDSYSQLHYDVYRDGKKTNVTHHVATDGSPKYLITADEFHCGEETFDRKATNGKGLVAWLTERT